MLAEIGSAMVLFYAQKKGFMVAEELLNARVGGNVGKESRKLEKLVCGSLRRRLFI